MEGEKGVGEVRGEGEVGGERRGEREREWGTKGVLWMAKTGASASEGKERIVAREAGG